MHIACLYNWSKFDYENLSCMEYLSNEQCAISLEK